MNLINRKVKFRRFRFYSDWVDVLGFHWGDTGYLLQVRVNRFNGKSFRCIAIKAWYNIATFGDGNHVFNLLEKIDSENNKENPNA